jgi:hypothetical protein
MNMHTMKRQALRWLRYGFVMGIVTMGSGLFQDVKAEDDDTESPLSMSLSVRQDNFFGFQAQVNGTYALNENLALAFYGIHWTDVRGADTGVGGNPWTEVGGGVQLSFWEQRLTVTPMIGTVHGQLLSRGPGVPGATFNNAGRATAFEGIVPNLTMNYNDGLLEGEIYAGYYKAIRDEAPGAGVGTWDFLHYWATGGVVLHKHVSIGVHYEELRSTRVKGGTTGVLYQWLGPYIEVKLPASMAFRFTAGPDLHQNADFYKLSFTKTF